VSGSGDQPPSGGRLTMSSQSLTPLGYTKHSHPLRGAFTPLATDNVLGNHLFYPPSWPNYLPRWCEAGVGKEGGLDQDRITDWYLLAFISLQSLSQETARTVAGV
jgi:hypothetical protein